MQQTARTLTLFLILALALVACEGPMDPGSFPGTDPTADPADQSDPNAPAGPDDTMTGAFSVSYHGNGHSSGTEPASVGCDDGELVTVASPGDLARAGHEFLCWNTDPDGFGTDYAPGDDLTILASDVDLYAQWLELVDVQTFTLTFRGNGNEDGSGDVVWDNDYIAFTEVQIPEADYFAFTKAEHDLAGFNTNADGSGTSYAFLDHVVFEDSDIVLFAEWDPQFLRMLYHSTGHTSGEVPVDSGRYYDGDETTVAGPGTLVRDGYTFLGWSSTPDGTAVYDPGDPATFHNADINLYAVWTDNPRSITYHGNGHSGGDAPVDDRAYGMDQLLRLKERGSLVRAGYKFTGWNTEADGSGTHYSADESELYHDGLQDLYADWRKLVYVSWDDMDLGPTLAAFDVTDPANIQYFADVPRTASQAPRGVAVAGDYVLLSEAPGRLTVLDVTKPRQAGFAGDIGPFQYNAYDVQIVGTYAYVAFLDHIWIVDVSNLPATSLVGSIAVSMEGLDEHLVFDIEGDRLYLYNAGLHDFLEVWDISNRANPVEIGQLEIGITPSEIKARGNHVFLLSPGGRNLRVLDASDPTNMTVTWTSPELPAQAFALAVEDGFAYVATEEIYDGNDLTTFYGLYVYDVSDPTACVEVGAISLHASHVTDKALEIEIRDGLAYIVRSYGLSIVDISTPSSPTEVGHYDGTRYMYGLGLWTE